MRVMPCHFICDMVRRVLHLIIFRSLFSHLFVIICQRQVLGTAVAASPTAFRLTTVAGDCNDGIIVLPSATILNCTRPLQRSVPRSLPSNLTHV